MSRPKVVLSSAVLLSLKAVILFASGTVPGLGQQDSELRLIETGRVAIDGALVAYRIRNLPVSSFPDLPEPVATALSFRGCLIPQTYEAKRPENVIHGSLERAGSSDWAVLCSARGQVSLLVFFASASASQPAVLATAPETERLQIHDLTGVLGFNWGIDPAAPKRIHEAQAGMAHRPAPPDHDCVSDSVIDHRTVYHLFKNGVWESVGIE